MFGGKPSPGTRLIRQDEIARFLGKTVHYLEDLDAKNLADGSGGTFALDWPQPVKIMQRNWIGRSRGAQVDFEIMHPEEGHQGHLLLVFTTRPATLLGVTIVVLAFKWTKIGFPSPLNINRA